MLFRSIYVVHVYHAVGSEANAKKWLGKARLTNDVDLIWLRADPLLKDLPKDATPNFETAERHITELLERDMPNLPYHNIEHVRDVVQSAKLISDNQGILEADQKIIGLAALLHDIGFSKGAEDHEARGAETARELLPQFGLEDKQIEVIANMILATKLPQSPQTHLEKILCDADLDYLGRDDFWEISRRLFLEMKNVGVVETERE